MSDGNGKPHLDPLQLLTLREVGELTRRSRSALERDIHDHKLRIVKLGVSVRVPRVELERYINEASQG